MIETETPAERRLRALADDGRSGAGDFHQIDEAHGRACDMGREALALVPEAIATIEALADQQAMPDDSYKPVWEKLRALLARAGGGVDGDHIEQTAPEHARVEDHLGVEPALSRPATVEAVAVHSLRDRERMGIAMTPTLPEALARVERLRDNRLRDAERAFQMAGLRDCVTTQPAIDAQADAAALTRVLAEVQRLREALNAMLAALSSPEDDEGLCVAHGEELDLCDACLYDRQKRMRAAADAARAALLETPP